MVKNKFIKTNFIKKKFHQKQFHQNPISSMWTLSSKTTFIKNHFHQNHFGSHHFLLRQSLLTRGLPIALVVCTQFWFGFLVYVHKHGSQCPRDGRRHQCWMVGCKSSGARAQSRSDGLMRIQRRGQRSTIPVDAMFNQVIPFSKRDSPVVRRRKSRWKRTKRCASWRPQSP